MGVIINLQKQLIMKLVKPLVLVTLMFSLLLGGCAEESGFSLAHTDYYNNEPDEGNNDSVSENKGDSIYGGGGGSNSEDHKEDQQEPTEQNIQPGEAGEEVEPTDLGTQIVTFNLAFVSLSEDDFAFVTCNDDPFADKYNFAYYTINNTEQNKSEEVLKETVNEVETYKFYVGSQESKTYTVEFYNKDGKQYGKAVLVVDVPIVHYSFFNNVVNIVQIKVVTVGLNIVQQFNKIGDFFKRLFGGSNGLTI